MTTLCAFVNFSYAGPFSKLKTRAVVPRRAREDENVEGYADVAHGRLVHDPAACQRRRLGEAAATPTGIAVKRFWQSSRSGVYFSVEQPGEIGAGDAVRIVEEHPLKVSVADVVSLYKGETKDADLYRRFMASPLAGSWKEDIRERWTER